MGCSVKHWCCATTIASSLQSRLETAGLSQLNWNQYNSVDNHELILVYDPPDQILERWRIESATAASIQDIKNIFEWTETYSKGVSCCVSSWRLGHLDTTSLIRLSNNEIPSLDRDIGFPGIRGLSGLITLNLLSENPEILECYLNLELKSCLLNLPPDSNYIGRLKQSTITDLVLTNWWEVNEERESSREEAMENLSRLHQIQDDYDQLIEQQEQLRQVLNQQNSLSRRALTKLAQLQNGEP